MEFLEIWAPFKDNWKYVCIMLQMNALLCESAGSAFFCHGFTAIMCKLQPDFQLEGAAVSEKCYDGNSSSFQLEVRLELAHNCHEAMAKKMQTLPTHLKAAEWKAQIWISGERKWPTWVRQILQPPLKSDSPSISRHPPSQFPFTSFISSRFE